MITENREIEKYETYDPPKCTSGMDASDTWSVGRSGGSREGKVARATSVHFRSILRSTPRWFYPTYLVLRMASTRAESEWCHRRFPSLSLSLSLSSEMF